MSQQHTNLTTIQAGTVIATLRGSDPEQVFETARSLVNSGVTTIEVTFTVPEAAAVIRRVAELPGALVGAGTVTAEHQLVAAVEAGARFIVSPSMNDAVKKSLKEQTVLTIPGALTPTEIWQALEAGAQLIKVFPISRMGGPAYIKDLLAPFPSLKIFASGGIKPDEVDQYWSAGAFAVGLGSSLATR